MSAVITKPVQLHRHFFGNCIIYGSQTEEIALDTAHAKPGNFTYYFEICDLSTQRSVSDPLHYSSNILQTSPGFNNTSIDDYSIVPSGSVRNAGNDTVCFDNHYPLDISGNPRSCASTLGAYQ